MRGSVFASTLACVVAFGMPVAEPVIGQSPQQGPAPRQSRPTEVFARLPLIETPEISPGGTHFAAKLAVDGRQLFAITDLSGQQRKIIGFGDYDLNWWSWVNDDWLVLGLGDTTKVQGQEWYIRRAVAVRRDGAGMKALSPRESAQNADDVIWTATDGSARVRMSFQTSIYVDRDGFWPRVEEIDLTTGRRSTVLNGRDGVMNWYADPSGHVRMGIGLSEDGRSRRLLYREPGQSQFRVIDRAKGRGEVLTTPAMFLADPAKGLLLGDDEGGFTALYELDLTRLERGRQMFAAPGYDLGGLYIDRWRNELLGVHVNRDRPSIEWMEPGMKAMAATIAGKLKGAHARIVSLDRNRGRAIVKVDNADAPGAYFLYDRASDTLALIAYVNEALELKRMHPVRTIRYKARDGLEIAAVLTLPKGASAPGSQGRGLPLIVLPHGGPFARDTEEWDWWTQFLADRGYAVVQPNYRGSSGYGTLFTTRGEGQWGLAMQDDLDDAVTALAAHGIADPKRVCVVGASYGGYAAMRAAQRNGDRYRCAVSYAGVSDLNSMIEYDSRFLGAGARTDWLRAQAPDLKQVSPLHRAGQFSAPILLVHGRKDRVVPYRQSKSMANALKHAGKKVTYVEQPEADHHFSRSADRLEFLTLLEAFLAEHNPA